MLTTPYNIKLLVSYEGTNYFGWQKNNAGPSIEAEFEKVLLRLFQYEIPLQAASRTDRGVHAKGQVINFFLPHTPNPKLLHSLNALLPSDIRVLKLEQVEVDFHPTLNAHMKTYQYEISTHPVQLPQERLYSWHYPYTLNIADMKKAAEVLIGTHDFTSFCNQKKNESYENHIRTIDEILIFTDSQGKIFIQVSGAKFLYKMVRNLIGALVYVGAGKLSSGKIQEILKSKNRTLAAVTAPAHGLTLLSIRYKHDKNNPYKWP